MASAGQVPNIESEVEHLRSRLAEAEETLEAIRCGEVDAVLVEGPNGPQVYTLQTPDQPYRVLVEGMSEGTAAISEHGIILFCNQRLSDLAGERAEKLAGAPVTAFVFGPDREHFQQLWTRSLEGEARGEVRFQRRDGTTVPVQTSLKLLLMEQQRSICMVATDLGDLKKAQHERDLALEELRKLNQELEDRVIARTHELADANKELETFNYAVAHDLRGPLRHIHGFANLLTEEAAAKLDESSKSHLENICSSAQHMAQLLEDLLELSRLGRQPVRKQICGLGPLVDEIVNSLKPETENRQVEWRIGDLPFIECDPGLMKQVLINLLSNALKFTRPRTPAVIEVSSQILDSEVVIYVRDNGVGFSPKYADKLFGLFERLHRQEDFEGTGVGLATVKRIVMKHGGTVWAEGELNRGATFYFKLRSGAARTEGRVA